MPEYCVTGGNGLIASYLIRELLSKGHIVRATVRDPDDEKKVGHLWSFHGAKERLRLVKAELVVDGSFDEAVDGVDGVFHTACPQANIKEVMMEPAIRGTMNVLNACAKARSVKRLVLTSTCAAIRYHEDADMISPLNESHWSDTDYCRKYNLWYAYAKTLAEKEAWRLAKEHNTDLVVVHPSFVVGPLITPQPTSTLQFLLSVMKGPSIPNLTLGFVHIDDVVSAHMIAMEDSRASGRLICSSSVAHWSEIIEMIRSKYPSYQLPTMCNEMQRDNNPHSMDTKKIKELGLQAFKTIPQMFDDCIKSFQEKGFL
ncbi:tetraketide alpha-pyrone reductase 2-like [Asparagus officinalis]|uniref:tetraketide alpha-pyrone reductase 2-like n=1 Tax=Asparagus officinalis TaxID=4686 RepID=UPI00098DF369|nr:tetraketide alpha-pyrone reductase 2-like [Asparagus officinalis]